MDDILTITFLVTVTLRQKRQWDGNLRQRQGEKIIVLNNVGCAFLKATVYMNKDYECFAFFQLIPCQTGRFENGSGSETNTSFKSTWIRHRVQPVRHRPSRFVLWQFW